MSVLHSLIGRRRFLASTLAGTSGVFLSAAVARAETTPDAPGGADGATVAHPTARLGAIAAGGSVTVAAASAMPSGDTSIRPFQLPAFDEAVADLRRRVIATNWPERETVTDTTQGVQLATIQKLALYWGKEYDWSKCEARLKALPHFITEIDGLDIHFIHVRSKHENALPVIVTHGWPGSIIEQLKIVDPLTNPTAHGGTASDAFDIVIPSLPGYGFSGKPTAAGWGPERIARAWVVLMKRLGYAKLQRKAAIGGRHHPIDGRTGRPELIGIHTNMPAPFRRTSTRRPRLAPAAARSVGRRGACIRSARLFLHARPRLRPRDGAQAADALRDRRFAGRARRLDNRPRHRQLQADRPRLRRSVRGPHERRYPRQHHALLVDQHSDLVGASLLGNTSLDGGFFAPQGIAIPVAVSAYPTEIYTAPRSWAEKAFPKLIYYNKVAKGGHFAAWEQPEFFTNELRAWFNAAVADLMERARPAADALRCGRRARRGHIQLQ